MAKLSTKAEHETSDDGLREKVVEVRRTTKVVKGGRQMQFSSLAVVGDGDSLVGEGKGKSKEVPVGRQKAMHNARKNMFEISLNQGKLSHDSYGRHGASKVLIMPAPEGKGIIAGGAMRDVFSVIGIRNVVAKSIGSNSRSNLVKATLKALKNQSTPAEIAAKRGLSIEEILS